MRWDWGEGCKVKDRGVIGIEITSVDCVLITPLYLYLKQLTIICKID